MNKEIKAEIRILAKAQKKILRDCSAVVKLAKKQIKQSQWAILRAQRNSGREFERAGKRIAILQGRLS